MDDKKNITRNFLEHQLEEIAEEEIEDEYYLKKTSVFVN